MVNRPPSKRLAGIPKFSMGTEADSESTAIGVAPRAPASVATRDRPYLIVIGGGSVGEMFPLRQDEAIIGRARDATIRFEDDGMSRKHACLRCAGKHVEISDLGSANGTFVNGEPVTGWRALVEGDKISVGSITVLKFTYNDELDEAFQRHMFDASFRDALTKAYNKKYLMERLDKELAFAWRHGTALSLILLDVDHFKRVNDTFGHPAGDAVLVNLAAIVFGALRKEDVFARYGGEEFAIICRGVDLAGAADVAERLRELVAQTHAVHEGRDLAVTASFGIASCLECGAKTVAELVASADAALYAAKRGGRNRVITAAMRPSV
ncbi:MAG TPA: GGDEF domain-containing protein [Polyangiaceae bacterium]|jgi:diguanylate cyclase (GGDEF)-like protein